jgi:parallel beta-helix repeat protein
MRMTKVMNSNLCTFLFYNIIFILIFSFFSPIKVNSVKGVIVTVPAEYPTIQAAIDAAQSGDTIQVSGGTYYENIIITKNLTLAGEDKDTTIIDGGKNGHVIHAFGTSYNYIDVNLFGFTIQNAGKPGLSNFDCIHFSYIHLGSIINNKVMMGDQSDGIDLDHCNNITIDSNTILNNPNVGIHLTLAVWNTISENTIQSNLLYGIDISMSSNHNTFFDNTFKKNGPQQVRDPLTNNWDYNGRGNYWDDYTGVDLNPKDGIGDTPYSIPGGGGNQDHYPLGFFRNSPEAFIDSITPNPALFGESVSLQGHGFDPDGGTIIGYQWRTDDQQLSSQSTFSTSSLAVGTHTISFKVENDKELWSSEELSILTITAPPEHTKPLAVIDTINPTQTTYGTPISFTGHGIVTDENIQAYKWTSNLIGVLSSDSSFNKSDLPVGTHRILFQVMDTSGEWSDAVSKTLIIFPKPSTANKPPIPHITGPFTAKINTSLHFTGDTSNDPDGEIILYQWDFGDGQTDSNISVNHTYSQVGNYTIKLTVTDNNGSQTTDSRTVSVSATGGQTDHQNNNNTGSILDWFNQIPLVIIAPFLGILIFVIIISFFFYKMRHS